MNCLNCEFHEVIKDPDPNDWFCADDMAVICKRAENKNLDLKSRWISDRSPYRTVTNSCRPYNLEKESEIPNWCPKV